MKLQNRLLIVTVAAMGAMFATQARAQLRTGTDDGIAASPKVRQMLDERARSAAVSRSAPRVASTTVASVGYRAVGEDGIAASPKVRQMLDEQKRNKGVTGPSGAGAWAGYRAAGKDGIAASPKVRQRLDERARQFVAAREK